MKTDTYPPVVTEIVLAFALLSRLPTPHLPDSAFARGAQAVWAYPLVGLVTASIAGFAALSLLSLGLPVSVASGIGLALLTVLTGALHEDGLADVADGFWGAYSTERRLEIMKDSQIGSYGTLALVFVTGLKWLAWSALLVISPAALIAAAVLSRAAMPVLMTLLPHARDTGLSHSVGRPARPRVFAGMIIALVLSVLLLGAPAVAASVSVALSASFMAWLSRARIGGQTGDVLGATQQVSELTALCLLLVLLQ